MAFHELGCAIHPVRKLPPIILRGVYQLPLDRGVHVTTSADKLGATDSILNKSVDVAFGDDVDTHAVQCRLERVVAILSRVEALSAITMDKAIRQPQKRRSPRYGSVTLTF